MFDRVLNWPIYKNVLQFSVNPRDTLAISTYIYPCIALRFIKEKINILTLNPK